MGVDKIAETRAFRPCEYKFGRMMVSTPWYVFVFGVLMGWIGLAGLADNLLEWRDWFDQGLMVHWRAMKLWTWENVLYWFPLSLSPWFVDYLVVGLIYERASFVAAFKKIVEWFKLRKISNANSIERLGMGRVAMYPIFILTFLFISVIQLLLWMVWPIFFVLTIFSAYRQWRDPEWPDMVSIDTIKIFIYSLAFSVVLLFIATDIVKTFNL